MLADPTIDRRPQRVPLEILVRNDALLIKIVGPNAELSVLVAPRQGQVILVVIAFR